jgi:hypothetical protein
MSAFASLTLVDYAVANVVFTPTSIDNNGVAKYLSSDAIFDAKKAVTMQVTLPKAGGSVSRVKQKIVIPIMDTVDTTKKVSECIISIEAVLPKNATLAQRRDLKALAVSLAGNAITTAAYESLESIY